MNTLLFFGTSEFAVPALKKLHESGFEIRAVLAQPDKPAGRKQLSLPSPVKEEAVRLGLKIFQPQSLKIGNWKLEIPDADIYIVVSYGRIIPKEILDIPRYDTLNIHPSLLPKYRGPSPIQATILNGDKETGVTIFKMDEQVDHGPVIASSKLAIRNSRLYFKELHDRLAELGAEVLIKVLPEYLNGKIKPVPQDDSLATYTKLITKKDSRINWQKSSQEIERLVRAYHLWPVAWTTLDDKRFRIYEVLQHDTPFFDEPGRIGITKDKIFVQCGKGSLELTKVQLEGSRKMSAKSFLNGYRNLEGKRLS